MRRYCEHQHPDLGVTAQGDRGPEEIIVLKKGQGVFWDKKRKSRWARLERKQKHKMLRTTIRNALQGDTLDRGDKGGRVLPPPRRQVEGGDNSEAPAAFQRRCDQGWRGLTRAKARDLDFLPGDPSSDSGSSSS